MAAGFAVSFGGRDAVRWRGHVRARACAAPEFEWGRLSRVVGDVGMKKIEEFQQRGGLVLPLSPVSARIVMPTDTVNVLMNSHVGEMILDTREKVFGATLGSLAAGVLVRVEEEHWGFSDRVQLRGKASQRFRVRDVVNHGALRLASVELFSDERSEGINEELELCVAMREVDRALNDLQKCDEFISERLSLFDSPNEELDEVVRFLKQVRTYRKVAQDSKDSRMAKEELFSFALLRALSLGEEDKVEMLRLRTPVVRLRFIELELRRGLAALRAYLRESYTDVPPTLLD